MASRTARATLLAALALSGVASALDNHTSSYLDVEALRAQLALMGDRPQDCPPWCASFADPFISTSPADLAPAAALTVCFLRLLAANMPSVTHSTASAPVPMDLEARTA